MGFRNPLTSAVDLDTGRPTGPGARLYQDTATPTQQRGVLEFRTGITGDVPATTELLSYQTTDPDGTIRSAGSSLRVRGASSNAVPAPQLELNVQDAPAGGYESLARLKATRVQLEGRVTLPAGDALALPPTTAQTLSGTPFPGGAPSVRAGSVVTQLNAASFGSLSWPAFPNGLITAHLWPGDVAGGIGEVVGVSWNLSTMNFRAEGPTGAAIPNATVRINFLALGW